jgi:hypothetical protein
MDHRVDEYLWLANGRGETAVCPCTTDGTSVGRPAQLQATRRAPPSTSCLSSGS